jgi:hypothetical protein
MHRSDGGASELAARLRQEPPELDEVARARMEKRLLEALRAQETPDTRSRPNANASSTRAWRVGVGVGALGVLAAVIFLALVSESAVDEAPAPRATFHSFDGAERVRQGALGRGDRIETGPSQRVEVRVAGSLNSSTVARVDVTPRSRAHVERLTAEHMRVRLERGAVEVEFHPERRGEQTMAVETSSARVEVVGTTFRVEVDDVMGTTVRVQQGTVRVVPTGGGPARMVHAGEETTVAVSVVAANERTSPDVGAVAETFDDRSSDPVASDDERSAPSERPAAPLHSTAAPSTTARSITARSPTASSPGPEEAPIRTEAADEESGRIETQASGGVESSAGAHDDPPTTGEGNPPAVRVDHALDLRDRRFRVAERLLMEGRPERGRDHLRAITERSPRSVDRVEAWTMIAESYENEGEVIDAAEAYRRASEEGGARVDGLAALQAFARMKERARDTHGACAQYRRYLQIAPDGPNVASVRHAFERLGCRYGFTSGDGRAD